MSDDSTSKNTKSSNIPHPLDWQRAMKVSIGFILSFIKIRK
jgi:hypothetical protein